MPAKKKLKESPPAPCYICGKEIYGEHVYIKTRGRAELYVCDKCMRASQKRRNEND